MKRCILELVGESSEAFHGVGRTALCTKLNELGIHIGDGKLRGLLGELLEQQLLTIGRGRCGCQITLKGVEFLDLPLTK